MGIKDSAKALAVYASVKTNEARSELRVVKNLVEQDSKLNHLDKTIETAERNVVKLSDRLEDLDKEVARVTEELEQERTNIRALEQLRRERDAAKVEVVHTP